jgi:hypothetical protein
MSPLASPPVRGPRVPFSFAALVTLLALPGVLATTGCGAIKKASECKALVTSINAGVTSLEAIGKGKSGNDSAVVGNLRKMADGYDKLGADTAKIEITTPELKKQAADYAALSKKSAQAARDFAAAIEAKDAQKARAAEKEFDKLADEEGKLADAMNKTCNG